MDLFILFGLFPLVHNLFKLLQIDVEGNEVLNVGEKRIPVITLITTIITLVWLIWGFFTNQWVYFLFLTLFHFTLYHGIEKRVETEIKWLSIVRNIVNIVIFVLIIVNRLNIELW